MFDVFKGTVATLLPPMVLELFGMSNLTRNQAVCLLIDGFAQLIAPPVAGWLRSAPLSWFTLIIKRTKLTNMCNVKLCCLFLYFRCHCWSDRKLRHVIHHSLWKSSDRWHYIFCYHYDAAQDSRKICWCKQLNQSHNSLSDGRWWGFCKKLL